MSSEAAPISASRFAKALEDLPVSSLHAKVAELQNSIAHLEKSNKELEDFARQEDDRDCYEALMENKQVIKRMEERIELVKREVTEVRGLPFQPESAKTGTGDVETGSREVSAQNGAMNGVERRGVDGQVQEQRNGSSTAEEEDGVFL